MVTAAVRGVVDFSGALPNDKRWWQRLRILLGGLDRQLTVEVTDTAFRYYLSQLSNANLTVDSRKSVQDRAQALYDDLGGLRRPWARQDKAQRVADEVTRYRQMYVDMLGYDPADPAYLAWRDRRRKERLAEQAKAQAVETPEQVVNRRKRQMQG